MMGESNLAEGETELKMVHHNLHLFFAKDPLETLKGRFFIEERSDIMRGFRPGKIVIVTRVLFRHLLLFIRDEGGGIEQIVLDGFDVAMTGEVIKEAHE